MMTPEQVPGLYKRRIGEVVVMTVTDGYLDISFDILNGATLADIEKMLDDAFRPGPPRLTVNAFVVQTSGRLILIDAGGGKNTVHSMGRLCDNLRGAGIAPDDIDLVLLTHIHPDHSSGLLDPSGAPMFPRAEIVLQEQELAFWSDPRLSDGRCPAASPYLESATALLEACRNRLRPIRDGVVVPGIRLIPLPGHTPGHSGYQIDSGGESLLIWGDTVHVPELQVPCPKITSLFDIDEALAIRTRLKVFDMVAQERLLVAGMHLHIPAFAYVVRSASGGYRLAPEAWSVTL